MMVVVLGVLPAGADGTEGTEHTEHVIRFVDENKQQIDSPINLEATVGQEFTHTFNISKCDENGEYGVTFTISYLTEGIDELPDGLFWDGEHGKIYGRPTAETTEPIEIRFRINVATDELCGEAAVTGSEVDVSLTVKPAEVPEITTLRIPYTKIVEQGGTSQPGPQTFTLEIFDVQSSGAEITINGGTNIIETNGSGNYTDYMSVTGTRDDLSEGFYVREVKDGAANWTYSDMVWFIQPQEDGTFRIHEENWEGTTRDSMLFINTYNYSPVRDDVDNDYDDDDDYDYDNDYDDDEDDDEDNSWFIRIPEKKVPLTEKPQVNELPQEETIPQENEVKDNPNTGLGSTWDYLVYLFHKCFFWTI